MTDCYSVIEPSLRVEMALVKLKCVSSQWAPDTLAVEPSHNF